MRDGAFRRFVSFFPILVATFAGDFQAIWSTHSVCPTATAVAISASAVVVTFGGLALHGRGIIDIFAAASASTASGFVFDNTFGGG